MSENSRGEDELQDLLAGKSVLSRSYRESSQEQPPANVDAAVLAAARWAVGADSSPGVDALPRATLPRRRKSFLDWGVPLATAAVVVVAVALTYSIERDPAITELYEKYDRDVLATLGVDPNPVVSEDNTRQGESVVPESLSAPSSSSTGSSSTKPSSTPAAPPPPKESEPVTVAEVPKAVVVPKEVVVPNEPVPPKSPVAKSKPAPKRAVVAAPSQTNEDAALKKKLLEQREIAERKRRQQSESAAVARSVVEADKAEDRAAPLIAEQQFSSVVAANEGAADTEVEAEVEAEPGRLDALVDLQEEQGKDVAEQEISGLVSEMPVATSEIAVRQELPAASLGAAQSMSDELALEDSQDALAETVRDPDDWIQDIEKLLSDDRRDEALESLKDFRSEYPDYSVPDNLRSLESAESE